jgi:hypothetical protein
MIYESHRLAPSLVSRVKIRIRRPLLGRKTSAPFISGDLFAKSSDFAVTSANYSSLERRMTEFREARVLFCESHLLHEILERFGSQVTARVLIAGNSDFDFIDPIENIPTSIRHMYLQNSFISDQRRVSTLPIGIENLRIGLNGFPRYFSSEIDWNLKTNKAQFGPYSLTHPIRVKLNASALPRLDAVDGYFGYFEPSRLATLSNQYKFVLAPRGNGVDTHRIWETFYRSSLPIVEASDWSKSLVRQGFDFGIVASWEPGTINELIDRRKDLPVRIGANLWWPYWRESISSHF